MTDGLGFFELLQLAEELGSELSMAVQDGQHSGPGGHYTLDADYPPLLQDAQDLLEFASGSAESSTWGKQRAAMGHPAPFRLRKVEVKWGYFLDLWRCPSR